MWTDDNDNEERKRETNTGTPKEIQQYAYVQKALVNADICKIIRGNPHFTVITIYVITLFNLSSKKINV
jgi:hypothetical protein